LKQGAPPGILARGPPTILTPHWRHDATLSQYALADRCCDRRRRHRSRDRRRNGERGGSSARFPVAMEVKVGEQPVQLTLTGAALRKRAFITAYAIASYLQAGVPAKTADELLAADGVKVLVMILERDVAGKDIVDGMRTGVRLNYPADAFAAELAKVEQVLQKLRLEKGDRVTLTAAPGAGLRCQVGRKAEVVVGDAAFARAIWDMYLGRKNLSDALKAGLVSRR
jgi:hypothetical protein